MEQTEAFFLRQFFPDQAFRFSSQFAYINEAMWSVGTISTIEQYAGHLHQIPFSSRYTTTHILSTRGAQGDGHDPSTSSPQQVYSVTSVLAASIDRVRRIGEAKFLDGGEGLGERGRRRCCAPVRGDLLQFLCQGTEGRPAR